MDEILKYYDELQKIYDSNELKFKDNSDHAHNAMILRLMLNNSNRIYMYCGSMSIFRNQFYNHIPVEYREATKNLVREDLIEFLNRPDTEITVIMENDLPEGSGAELIVDAEMLSSRLTLLKLPNYDDNLYRSLRDDIYHFSFTEDGRIVRMETDKTNHKAVCRIAKIGSTFSGRSGFDDLLSVSEPVASIA